MEQYPGKKQTKNNELALREAGRGTSYLPSNEVREIIPEFEDEIDLRDLLDTLIRRKTLVLVCLLVCFFSVALYTFTVTPQFKAKGVLKVSAQSEKITKFDDLDSSALKTMEFQQTQVKLLQSEQLAIRVIERMDLNSNKTFNPSVNKTSEQASLLDTLKSFIRPEEDLSTISRLNDDARAQIRTDKALRKFHDLFTVSPIKNSELVEVSFESPSPGLASDVTNTAMDEFVNMTMDNKLQMSQNASRFLNKQIEAAQIKLEESEQKLQKFARGIGIVSLDPKQNLVMKQLEELNTALAEARAQRVRKEARYKQLLSPEAGNLKENTFNELLWRLKNQYATLLAQYQQMGTTFKPAYPKMVQLKAQMEELHAQIRAEEMAIADSVRDEYETALKEEQYLQERTEEQKKRAMALDEKATQYKIFAREVETNKSIYQSLLQRAKEIEATVGASVTNIQIIDQARPPLYPFKPRILLNLLIGLAVGLVSGIGAAFIAEFFDNTIKNPDEMSDRFGIPVLGLIPFDKEAEDDRKYMALKFHDDPRSPVAEAFRTTMTSVRLSVADNPPKTILVTSILPGAGKSSSSSNACFSYLSEEEKVLLIDVDLRKPSLHHVFNSGLRGKGLSSVLTGMAELSDVILHTGFSGLDYISSGPLPPNPAELLSSRRMRQLLEVVSEKYDRIILDGPPYQGFAEILVLANMVDGVILISVEGDTPREGVKHFRRAITNVGGRILGTIINKSGRRSGFGSYGGYKYYAYNYSYGSGEELEEHEAESPVK